MNAPGTPRIRGSGSLLGTSLTDLAILAAVFALLGTVLVGSHWTSTWVDREFTGWVAPLSHLVGEGPRMYEDGRHSPLPPLPTLLLWAVAPRPATWYAESLSVFLFQSATLVVMYGVLRGIVSRPGALWAVLAGAPVFFALPKTILYDPLAQCLVALLLAAVAGWFHAFRAGAPARSAWAWIVVLGGLSATLLLTKQSTGLGASAGVALVLAFFPRSAAWRRRWAGLALYGAASAAFFGLECAAISPWVSISGMIFDVFLTGSEPKGGPAQMIDNLLGYAGQIVRLGAVVGLGALAVRGLLRQARWQKALLREQRPLDPATIRALQRAGVLLPIGCLAVACLVWMEMDPLDRQAELQLAPLTCGLCVLLGSLIAAARRHTQRTVPECGPVERFLRAWFRPPRFPASLVAEKTVALVLVALASAAFHNLSVSRFRWTYDNNPLVILALGAVAAVLEDPVSAWMEGRRRGTRARKGCLAAVMVVCWMAMLPQWQAARECQVPWPEVAHLRGARLRPKAHSLRALVGLVHRWAPRQDDRVLVLPGDPNLESWLERPRPELTSSILFTDQYWDRYVEEDLRRLQAEPPQVIVVGPRLCWRPFARVWHANWGAERLIDGVEETLIPEGYRLVGSAAIELKGLTDYMDVYARRRDGPPVCQASGAGRLQGQAE